MKYHFYKFQVEKKYLYRILNCREGVCLKNIIENNQRVSFEIEAGNLSRFLKLLEREKIPVRSYQEQGVRTKFTFSVIKVLGMATVIILVGLWFNSRYIWNISVDGNYSYTEEQLKAFIYTKNYREGIRKSEVQCSNLETLIRNRYPDISWVSCEIKGTNLMVHIKENYIAEISARETKPYHLVSNVSGTIVSVIARSGQVMVKKGQQVKKGECLISGIVETKNESDEVIGTHNCMADGDIKAKVTHQYNDYLNQKQIIVNPSQRRTYSFPFPAEYVLKITGKENRYLEKSSSPIVLFDNYYLPVQIHSYTVYEKEPKTIQVSSKEAEQILHHKMLYYFAQLEQKGYKILKKDVKMVSVKKKYCLQGSFVCIEPIGKVEYINLEKEERERCTNERN
ncbi:MAG: sporulation protein YqfD [Eubacterium sp.]|nr:sporulation protein YqfD [Eubacterium sp.]